MSHADLPEDVERQIRQWSTAARHECERDPWFWTREKASILSRARQQRRVPYLMPIVATAATVVVALGLFLGAPAPRMQAPTTTAGPSMESVLQETENNLEREVPEALAPVALLTRELDAQAAQHSSSRKENKNEM